MQNATSKCFEHSPTFFFFFHDKEKSVVVVLQEHCQSPVKEKYTSI